MILMKNNLNWYLLKLDNCNYMNTKLKYLFNDFIYKC